jgi:hypothetical protein
MSIAQDFKRNTPILCSLGMVQMHVTVPHRQQGPALSS